MVLHIAFPFFPPNMAGGLTYLQPTFILTWVGYGDAVDSADYGLWGDCGLLGIFTSLAEDWIIDQEIF